MAFTEEERKRILEEIAKRANQKPGVCPICRNPYWNLNDGITPIIIQKDMAGIVLGGPVLPCVSLTCSNCGNTQFLNLIALGFRELLSKEKERVAEEEKNKVDEQKAG